MAYTVTPDPLNPQDVWGKTEIRWVTLQPAVSDYVNGTGYALTPGQGISLRVIQNVIPVGGQGGWVPVWNPTLGTVQMYGASATSGGLTEAANGANLSALAFKLEVRGT